MALAGQLKPIHLVVALAILAGGNINRWSRDLIAAGIPALSVGLAYDWMRILVPLRVLPERVWGCELRSFELKLFGVGPDTTLADFFQTHHSTFLDLFFAVPYAGFLYICAIYAIYLYFHDRPRMVHYLMAFGIVHLIAFTVYLIMPAAPPWYIRAYGCGIDMTALPSPARLARVDELLGIGYFKAFYSQNANVFGAMPSLHCAMPILGLLTAWPKIGWRTRPIHLGYMASMIVASLYLDHHWLLDGLAGIAAAAISVVLAGWLLTWKSRTANGPAS
jgi:membrane-associated phospholipid phosphatase